MQSKCKFCNYLQNPEKNDHQFAVVFQNEHFVAVPTLGCLVPGYLLIIPKRHILCMAQMNEEEIRSFVPFVEQISSALSEIWSAPTIFEHGACCQSNLSSNTVDHAHWHLVPGHYEFLSNLPPGTIVESIPSFDYFIRVIFKQEPYLYYQDDTGNSYIIRTTNPVRQLFRRILAACIGRKEEWDYSVYPYWQNIQDTLNKITSYQVNKHRNK